MRFYNNPILEKLPKHLARYVVDQNYARYTPEDQAIWRYVMRQNYAFLKDVAYYPYIPGLKIAGLSIERIPDLQKMNDSLQQIGWGAVTVDGFIPPAAFMEFQANCVLVIAADIRQIDHITYTPAPDIIHESSGHAPIIGEPEYAAYLQYFGEIGAKAMSSSRDFEVYEAIRRLSILKEQEEVSEQEITEAHNYLNQLTASMGEPSEMALLSRLHWWTVEYGLIGNTQDYKIYGAGLLSSIGESATCLQDDVQKLPYSLEALKFPYDITKPQPQLFVTADFQEAYRVLEDFADTMAFKKGGQLGMQRAIDSGQVCTAVYNSGLQVSGTFEQVQFAQEVVWIKTTGPTALAYQGKQLTKHGKTYHQEGFSAPVGPIIAKNENLSTYSEADLSDLAVVLGQATSLKFQSGILVSGKIAGTLFHENQLLLISFKDCTVLHEPSQTVLFRPEYGVFDMAVGEQLLSAFAGAADKFAFEPEVKLTELETKKIELDNSKIDLHCIYASLRKIREDIPVSDTLFNIYEDLKEQHAKAWLAMLELYELSYHFEFTELSKFVLDHLKQLSLEIPALNKLIHDGIHLAETEPINLELASQQDLPS